MIAPSPAVDSLTLEEQVVQLRGLQPVQPIAISALPLPQLRSKIVAAVNLNYPSAQAEADAVVFALLGLLPAGYDLQQTWSALASDQATDFFDSQTGDVFVGLDPGSTARSRLMSVRGYDLALLERRFSLGKRLGWDPMTCLPMYEACAAARGLIEGDAGLLQEQWLRTYASAQDLSDLAQPSPTYPGASLAAAPAFLREAIGFPAQAGIEFVRRLYLKGGWAAVDAAYASPPASTEQILHPERYPRSLPVVIHTPDLTTALGPGWSQTARDTLGEWDTRMMLETILPPPDAEQGASGWGGDEYSLYHDAASGLSLWVWIAAWDGLHEAYEFASTFEAYADARYGKHQTLGTASVWTVAGQYITFESAADETLWIVAPDAATNGAARHQIAFPVRHS